MARCVKYDDDVWQTEVELQIKEKDQITASISYQLYDPQAFSFQKKKPQNLRDYFQHSVTDRKCKPISPN